MYRIAVVVVAFALALSLAVPREKAFAENVILLKFSNFFPAPHKNSIIIEQWCKEIEKRTNGRVKINYYPGATLTPPQQTYDSVAKGIADIGEALVGYTQGKFPLTAGLDLPLGQKSGYLATKMANAYYKKFKPKEFDEVQVMFLSAHGPAYVNTKKPVNTLEDMKGLKIRASGQTAAIVKALGAAPVGLPQTETYDALSKGVVEGAMSPLEAMKGWKLGEVTKYHTLSPGTAYASAFYVVMNKQKWNSLPPDVQKIIEQINEEWIEKQGKLWDEIDKEGLEFVKARGNKLITLTSKEDARWIAAVKPVLDDYLKATKAKGVPGDEALKFFQDYLKKNQK
jgi:TRAP-type transport system periplasmic protein